MDVATAILQNDLAGLLPLIIIGMRVIANLLWQSETLPTVSARVFYLSMIVPAMLLAFANYAIHKSEGPVVGLANLWPIQGLAFWIGMMLGDKVTEMAYASKGTLSKAVGGGTGILLGLLVALCLVAPPAAQAASSEWDRVSIGVGSGALFLDAKDADPATVGFAAQPYVTYNLAELLTLSSSYEWELTNGTQLLRVGARTPLINVDRIRLYAGLDYVHYSGLATLFVANKDSWQVNLQGSVPLLSKMDPATLTNRTVVWLVAGASLDPQDEKTPLYQYRAYLRWQIKPVKTGAESK